MARIRSIKPEFPQSESMGRVSRDARLAFIQMWTVADDAGRLRGNSRMLASLLFPYDDDAPQLMDLWIAELEGEGCIVRYKAEGQSYIQIKNWSAHQKIDKPSQSKIPPFVESSRTFAESSRTIVGGEEGRGEEGKGRDSNSDELLVASPAADLPELLDIEPSGKPPCPHKQIVALYHEILPMCPQIRDWTPARAEQLRARWNEAPERQNLDYWKRFFEYVKTCGFLVGIQPDAKRRPFFADLEWLTKQANFTKVREGRYEPRD